MIPLERPVVEPRRDKEQPKERHEQFEYLHTSRLEPSLGAKLDGYPEREEAISVVGVEVEITAQDTIRLPSGVSDLLQFDVTQLSSSNPYLVSRRPDGRRLRAILSKPVRDKLKLIEDNQLIEGEKVPEFLQNPQAVLPDGLDIDLSQYSDRVKSLGIKVYKARPYVRASQRDNGWFDIGVGVHLEDTLVDDASETAIAQTLDQDQLAGLVREAPEGARWLKHGNSWIQLPENIRELTKANEKVRKVAPQGQVAPERLDYILEIYANIENLEYDRFLIDRRKRLASRVELGTSLPDCFQGELYPFQIDGYCWMQDLYAVPLGGLLADEMGLGKTVQVIAFMSWLLERKCLRPSLIVVPLALVENWESELMRFLPGITVLKHMGPQRIRRSEVLEKIDVVITTYDTLSRDELMLGKVSWQLMVCDEAQAMKNYTTTRGPGVQGYESRNALGSHWYPGREQPRRALVDSRLQPAGVLG